MANFAKAQLLKYGWTEGKGLGKNENGITEALKPKLKFNTEGLGHKLEEVQWWESAFNNAAKNVLISSENDEVSISVTNKNISSVTKENSKGNQSKQEQYNNFRKTSMLQDEKMIMLENTDEKEEEEKPIKIPLLTDDELFKACGGRTAHKGARHGLGLNGKLERIAKQEKKLLGLMSNLSNKEITNDSTLWSKTNVENKDEVDSNANAILNAIDASFNEDDGFIKSKATLKKERKKMRHLSHLLSVSCNIDENSSSMISVNGKKSSLKRKRSKDRKTNVNNEITDGNILSTVILKDHDMSLLTNSVLEKKHKKHKKHSKHSAVKEDTNTSLYDYKTLCHDSTRNTSSKLKKKRSKSQENGEVSTETAHGSEMKYLKSQKRKMVKLMEKMNFGNNSEDEHIKNEENNSLVDAIKSERTFSSDEALRLNRRISKKKKNRLNKKNRLDKKNKIEIHFNRTISTVTSRSKRDSVMAKLMSIDVTDDVSAKLRALVNERNTKLNKGKNNKNSTDCNTDL